MSKKSKWALAIVVVTAIVITLVWAFLARPNERTTEAERDRPVATASRLVVQNGEAVVKMPPADQQRNGIAVAPLTPTARRQEFRATAVVLSMQELNDLRNRYVSAKAQLQKTQASLEVSHQEYERLEGLYQHERNASAKAVQAAEGTMRADEAANKAAQDAVFITENDVRQRWGPRVATWLLDGSPEFDRLVRQQDLLIQATPISGTEITAPPTASIQTAQGQIVSAGLVSRLPRLDPRLQAPSFLYVTRSNPNLIPGMSLILLLPSGTPVQGVVIPRDAVVWWNGRAWAYVQTAADQFVRREVSMEMPVPNGWFTAMGFSPDEKVVVTGAQQLLSEEFRSQLQGAGEEAK
jgi:hypothetical protein